MTSLLRIHFFIESIVIDSLLFLILPYIHVLFSQLGSHSNRQRSFDKGIIVLLIVLVVVVVSRRNSLNIRMSLFPSSLSPRQFGISQKETSNNGSTGQWNDVCGF